MKFEEKLISLLGYDEDKGKYIFALPLDCSLSLKVGHSLCKAFYLDDEGTVTPYEWDGEFLSIERLLFVCTEKPEFSEYEEDFIIKIDNLENAVGYDTKLQKLIFANDLELYYHGDQGYTPYTIDEDNLLFKNKDAIDVWEQVFGIELINRICPAAEFGITW